jgi:hypothetical protein
MTPAPDHDFLERLAEALVMEIKAEMGRRSLSARGLAALIGENPQYVTSRIGAGNPRTGKRVPITISDLAVIAGALDQDPLEMLSRARVEAGATPIGNVRQLHPDVSEDVSTLDHLKGLPSAAAPKRRDTGQGDDDA